ncbi:MAG: DUF6647 family protein [Planctomycetota bacterium]
MRILTGVVEVLVEGSKIEGQIMEALLAVIGLWLSVNYGLSVDEPHPKVAFSARQAMTQTWIGQFTNQQTWDIARLEQEGDHSEILGFYDSITQTIVLPEGWDPTSPRDVSILVHEMVHHGQYQGRSKYACSAQRERLAYQAQDEWLSLFEKSLESEFEIDPMTLLIRTKCMF